MFYDITASPEARTVDRRWIDGIARLLDIPFCVAGGIRSVADAEDILNKGADKISINSPALANPALIDELAKRFGSQCVVLGVDSQSVDGTFWVYQNTGDPGKTSNAKRETRQWIQEAQDRGIGEVVLNCMRQDGMQKGYDLEHLNSIRPVCDVPLIASGGAGAMQDFANVFTRAGVDGALAASVFHSGDISITALKRYLANESIDIRLGAAA